MFDKRIPVNARQALRSLQIVPLELADEVVFRVEQDVPLGSNSFRDFDLQDLLCQPTVRVARRRSQLRTWDKAHQIG
jgi:hypothetical protein